MPQLNSNDAESRRAAALPDTYGLNLYRIDHSLRSVLPVYLEPGLLQFLEPHLDWVGANTTTRLDDLASTADKNPSVLHHRTRRGIAEDRIEKPSAYVELEGIAFGKLGLAAMSHRPGVLGWNKEIPAPAKYALTYLFTQSEFGLMCPVNMTDSLTRTLTKYGDKGLIDRFLPTLTSTDVDTLSQGSMFITEQQAGSDVGRVETVARLEDGVWRLYGEKWFCSNADAALAMVLARPEGAKEGTKGLGLFLLPRVLDDGTRNRYRIVRLKDKLGTKAMPSGEIVLEGALAYLVGNLGAGFHQMTEMINMSRISNGVRAAGLMRRSMHEAIHVARNRSAFGRSLIDMPLMRRQLVKMLVPTEQALSFALFTANELDGSDAGDATASSVVRILTPLIKFRACRDARIIAGDSMEVRGGCGYVEEWINARLVRESHLGSIWEGTSNVVALDVVRAARKLDAHHALQKRLEILLDSCQSIPAAFRKCLQGALTRAVAFVDHAVKVRDDDLHARKAATALYNATSAIILAHEGSQIARRNDDARRMVLAHQVLVWRLGLSDPLKIDDAAAEARVQTFLLDERPPSMAEVTDLLAA